jgi:hypothetical protein
MISTAYRATRLAALAFALSAAVSAPLGAALAQHAHAAPRVEQIRAGRYVVTIYPGSPPGLSNGSNSFSRGIRVYAQPRNSTFAAVAAQEIFELDFKARGGFDKRQMELISHQIESLVASRHGGFDLAAFELKEARNMTHYSHMRGMSQGEILAAMRAVRPIAERWLAENRHVLQALLSYRR